MNIAVAGEVIWQRFAKSLDRADWIEDVRYKTAPDRSKNRDALNGEIADIIAMKPTAYWIETLIEAGVPAGEINDISQVFANPQVRHLGLAQPVTSQGTGRDRTGGPAHPHEPHVQPHRRPAAHRGPAHRRYPDEIGYSDDEIAAMKASGAI